MDFLIILQIIVLFGAIFLGVKLGGLGIGYAGGLGVVVLSLGLGMKPGNIPWDVILIIMSVIAAITAMEKAGGLDYLVQVASNVLRKNPKYINFLAPTVTYLLTIFAGTGHTTFSMIPVIVEVAKKQNIRPSVPLSIAVVAGQIAITASPVSAAVVFMSGLVEPLGCSYPMLLLICIPTTYIGCMLAALVLTLFSRAKLDQDPIYIQKVKDGLIKEEVQTTQETVISSKAKTSVWIFLIGVLCVVFYATAISPAIGLIQNPALGRDAAIMTFMLTIATLIVLICKVDTSTLADSSVFKSGMVACVCVLGVAWLGDTFVSGHIDGIKEFASGMVSKYPGLLAVALAFASMLLYSQAATAKAIFPAVILALGITADNNGQLYILIASFAAASALFILPTYPTLLGAVNMDYTGSTRIGKYIFNHPFMFPGVLAIVFSVLLGFLIAPILL